MKDTYEITVQGPLRTPWAQYFDGLAAVRPASDGIVQLGPVTGREALLAVLDRIAQLNLLILLAVQL